MENNIYFQAVRALNLLETKFIIFQRLYNVSAVKQGTDVFACDVWEQSLRAV